MEVSAGDGGIAACRRNVVANGLCQLSARCSRTIPFALLSLSTSSDYFLVYLLALAVSIPLFVIFFGMMFAVGATATPGEGPGVGLYLA